MVAISLRQYGERMAPLVANARRGQTKLAASTDDFAQSTQTLTSLLSQFRLP